LAGDPLKILITATLNKDASTEQINRVIKEIEKNISSIKLNFEIPNDLQNKIRGFVEAIEKIKTAQQDFNRVVKEEVQYFENLDGTITKTIRKHLESGEIITKTIEKHKESAKAIEQERRALADLFKEYENLREFQGKLKSTSITYDEKGQRTGASYIYSNRDKLLKVETDALNNIIRHTVIDQKETEKLKQKKAELRAELVKLAQVGQLSAEQLANIAKQVNQARDLTALKQAQTSLKEIQKVSKERLRFLELERKADAIAQKEADKLRIKKAQLRAELVKLAQVGQLSSQQLANVAKQVNTAFDDKSIRKAQEALKEAQKASQERLKFLQLERQVIEEQNRKLAGATKLGVFGELRKDIVTGEDIKRVLQLSEAYRNMEIRAVRLNQVTGQWTATLRLSASENLNLKGIIDRTTGSIYEQERAIAEAAAKNLGVFKQLGIALQRVPVWMGAMTAFYGPIRGLRNAVREILEIDKQMTALMRVSNGEIERQKILRESIELADRLGNRITQINDGIENFARQGFRGAGLIAMTEAATLFSNISDMDVEEAASGLTAIIKGFQMLPEEVMRAVDAINEVDNNFAITSQDIVQAMQKSVGAANTFNVEMEKLIGYITAVGQVTRESGSVLGNFLKTIFSRITTMKESVEILASVGISVKEIRDGVETVRPVSDILDELAKKWNNLNTETQQNIALQLAGRWQLSRFLVLMQNYDEAIKATTTALNSQGSAYRENENYLQSLEARINKMKNAGTELALALSEAFISDSIVVFTEQVANLARSFSDLINQTGAFPIAFGAIGGVAALVSKNFRTLTISVLTLGKGLQSLGVSANTAKVALRGLAASTAIGAAFVAIGYILEKLINRWGESIRQNELFAEKAQESIQKLKDQADIIDDLVNKYEKLKPNVDSNEQAHQELVQVMKQLQEIAPQLTRSFNLNANALELNTQEARAYAQQLREMSEEQKKLLLAKIDTELFELDKELNKANKRLQKEQKNYEETLKQYHELLAIYGAETPQQFYDAWERAVEQGGLEGRNLAIDEAIFSKLYEKIQKTNIKEIQNQIAQIQEQISKLNESKNVLNGVSDSIDGLTNSTSNLANQTSRSIPYFDQAGKYLGTVTDEAELLAKGYKILDREMENLEDGTSQLVSYVVEFSNSLEDQIEKVDGLSSSASFLADVYKTLSEGEELSLDQIIKLISEYPELIGYLDDHNNLIKNEGELLNWVIDLRRKKRLEEIQALIDENQAIYNALEQRRQLYREFYMRWAGQMPADQLKIQGESYKLTPEEEARLEHLANELRQLQAMAEALSKPIDIKKLGDKQQKELNPFVPDEYARALEEVNVQMAILEAKKARVSDKEEELITLLRQEIELYKLQQDLAHREAERLRSVNKQLEDRRKKLSQNSQEFHDLSEKIWNNESKILSLQQTWRQLERQIVETNKTIEEANKKRIEKLQDDQDKWVKSVQSAAKEAMEIIEDYYKEQERKAKESLDRQLDEFNEFIDSQLKLLDRLEETEDYQKELAKKQQERARIEARINELILDDSYKAQAERRELEEELAKIIEEIDEYQLERQRKLRRQNFQDLKDTKKKQIEEEKRAVEETWRNALATDQYYLSLRENLLNNNVAALQNTLMSFADNVSNYMIHIGDAIQQNTIDKIIAAQREIERIKSLTSTIRSNQLSEEQKIIYQMMANSAQWRDADAQRRAELHAANVELAKKIGAVFNASEGRWYKNGIPLYHSGGEIGTKTIIGSLLDKILNKGEVPIIAKKGELVLRDPTVAYKNLIKSFVIPQIRPAAVGSTQNIYQLTLHVENINGTRQDVDRIFRLIDDGLRRLGKR